MKTKMIISSLAWLILFMGVVPAPAKDLPGSRDHPLMKRYEGSEIIKYDHKDFGVITIPLAPSQKNHIKNAISVEGALTRLTYKAPVGRSALEVVRNYEKELEEKGFEILFKGAQAELGPGFAEAAGYRKIELPPNIPIFYLNEDSQRFLVMKQGNKDQGEVYVAVFAVEQDFWASDLKNVEKGQVLIQVDLIETKPMEQKMVTVTADEMARQIASSGGVALYGIFFDFNKSDIKPESEPTLREMAKFLKSSSNGGFLVVGHTDSVGSYESNVSLSQKRAEAVVKSLTGTYGVSRNKLKPVGMAYASPKATNRTEEGRAKNRRVELVEY